MFGVLAALDLLDIIGSMESCRTPDERFDDVPGYDFAPRYLEQDGLRMHYLRKFRGSGAPLAR